MVSHCAVLHLIAVLYFTVRIATVYLSWGIHCSRTINIAVCACHSWRIDLERNHASRAIVLQ